MKKEEILEKLQKDFFEYDIKEDEDGNICIDEYITKFTFNLDLNFPYLSPEIKSALENQIYEVIRNEINLEISIVIKGKTLEETIDDRYPSYRFL